MINANWKNYYKYNKKKHQSQLAYRTLDFGNYEVKKCSNTFYGVYSYDGSLITSATSFKRACKKAELLQIGFNEGADVGYCNGIVDSILETDDD